MFDRIRALLQHLHNVQEVNAMTDRDLDDLGMSRDQVLAFLRMPHDVSERVAAMGAIFGIPETVLKRDHAEWVELLTVCGHCADRAACSKVLARADFATPADAGFCGNRRTFANLAPRAA